MTSLLKRGDGVGVDFLVQQGMWVVGLDERTAGQANKKKKRQGARGKGRVDGGM